jgi:hypothetical protein
MKQYTCAPFSSVSVPAHAVLDPHSNPTITPALHRIRWAVERSMKGHRG